MASSRLLKLACLMLVVTLVLLGAPKGANGVTRLDGEVPNAVRVLRGEWRNRAGGMLQWDQDAPWPSEDHRRPPGI